METGALVEGVTARTMNDHHFISLHHLRTDHAGGVPTSGRADAAHAVLEDIFVELGDGSVGGSVRSDELCV